jgi:microcystin-dependent protein
MSLPVGTIVGMIGVNPNSPPSGWLYCNGSTFDGQRYDDLAKIFPNNKLPNLAGLILIGASNSYQAGGTYGSETVKHTLTIEEMPKHQHFGFGESSTSDWPYNVQGSNDKPGSAGGFDKNNCLYGTTETGGNREFSLSVIQPSYAVNFFIKATED